MAEEIITAEELAKGMREISIAEFFEKNKHFLGYENPTRSLLTVVKEAIDNSLDATCDAKIIPDIVINIKEIDQNRGVRGEKGANNGEKQDRFRITVKDNGPGVMEQKVPFAFGKFLYGSKFHRLRQSRGIMGLGISGSVLYSQLTTGKPVKITTSTGEKTHVFGLMIDVAKNEPRIVSHTEEENPDKWHGVEIEMDVEGRYTEGAQSIPEYIKQTAIANPYAKITYRSPNGKVTFSRTVKELPVIPKEIKPHPYGVELGVLERMLLATNAGNIVNFLMTDFSRVGKKSAETICKLARIEPRKKPKDLTAEESERLHDAMQKVKLMAPPTNCLSPLTESLIEAGLKKEIKAEHFVATLRSPSVYRGFPFQISVGLAYGGELPPNETCQLLRFANRIPLIYHQGDCAITQAMSEIKWSDYGLHQGSGALPVGPLAVLVHFASVWVPFTTEGKQAIASYPEIIKEVKLALQDAGRKLSKYIVKKRKEREKFERRQLFERYIPVVAESLSKLTKKDKKVILDKLEEFLKNKIEVKKLAGSEEGT